jgi:hypothetical protein
MRCPKCGFISFDHQENCLKCKKKIKIKSENLQGSVFQSAAPAFLSLQTNQEDESSETLDLFEDQPGSDEEYVDEDLVVLTDDEEPETVDEIDFADNEDIEEEGIEIDLSMFEDAADPADSGVASFDETEKEDEDSAEPSIAISVPPELSDISDLAPPPYQADVESEAPEVADTSDFPDMELDDLNFDLGLGDLEDAPVAAMEGESETVLVLDDLDFSDSLAKSGSDSADGQGSMNMDEDLNFDLDLGGLSIHNEV